MNTINAVQQFLDITVNTNDDTVIIYQHITGETLRYSKEDSKKILDVLKDLLITIDPIED